MSDLTYCKDVRCEAQRCRNLLLDRAFLAAFVELQQPIAPQISVSPQNRSSDLAWTVKTEGIPAVFSRLLPVEVPVELVIVVPESPGSPGSISVNLTGKPKGRLRASLEITAHGQDHERARLAVQGSFTINLGLLSGNVSNYLRGELILPMLDELGDLLEHWSGPSSGP